MRFLSLLIGFISLVGVSNNAISDGMTCVTETGLLLKREIKEGYSAEEVRRALNSRGLKYTYVSRDEANRVIDTSGMKVEKRGAEFLIRVPLKKPRQPQIVHEVEVIAVRLDYHSDKVIAVDCSTVRTGP